MYKNQYIYFSSKGSTSHNSNANFTVNLPTNVLIDPYSEVRVVNIQVQSETNAVVINNSNNTMH